jgi:hypothetical protein
LRTYRPVSSCFSPQALFYDAWAPVQVRGQRRSLKMVLFSFVSAEGGERARQVKAPSRWGGPRRRGGPWQRACGCGGPRRWRQASASCLTPLLHSPSSFAGASGLPQLLHVSYSPPFPHVPPLPPPPPPPPSPSSSFFFSQSRVSPRVRHSTETSIFAASITFYPSTSLARSHTVTPPLLPPCGGGSDPLTWEPGPNRTEGGPQKNGFYSMFSWF